MKYKCYIMIELTFLKKLILIKQVNQECDICHYWHFLNKGFRFKTYVFHRYHDLLMMSRNLNNIAILKIKNDDYHCIIVNLAKGKL